MIGSDLKALVQLLTPGVKQLKLGGSCWSTSLESHLYLSVPFAFFLHVIIHVKSVDKETYRLFKILGDREKCTTDSSLTALGRETNEAFFFLTNSVWSRPDVHVFALCCGRQ